jgi:hypothetical protein
MDDIKINTIQDIYDYLKKSKNTIYDKVSYSHPIKTKGKVKNIQLGRLFINLLLPADYPLIDSSINGKLINDTLSEIANKYPPETAASITKKMNEECLNIAAYYPATFNIDSLKLPANLIKKKKQYLTTDLDPSEFADRMKTMGEEYIEYLKSIDSGVYDMAKAGAGKSSSTDLAVFYVSKGPVAGFDGKISKPILNCINDGLTLDEFYQSAEQARFANYIRSTGTSEPGALARLI